MAQLKRPVLRPGHQALSDSFVQDVVAILRRYRAGYRPSAPLLGRLKQEIFCPPCSGIAFALLGDSGASKPMKVGMSLHIYASDVREISNRALGP